MRFIRNLCGMQSGAVCTIAVGVSITLDLLLVVTTSAVLLDGVRRRRVRKMGTFSDPCIEDATHEHRNRTLPCHPFGCSGGGKSILLAEPARRGFATVDEPGRRIVLEGLCGDGEALPWTDLAAFARRAMTMARTDRLAAPTHGWVFFDRSLVDAATALQHATGEPALAALEEDDRYHRKVFMTPPWSEIYSADSDRRHGFDEAVAEYERCALAIPVLDMRS